MICVCVLLFASCKRYISYDDEFDFDLEEGCSDFYYRQLSENQQKMYRMIYKEAQEVMRGGSKSDLGVYKYSDYNLTKQDALTVWDAFYFDTPAFFFMSNLYDNDDNSIKVKIFKEFSNKSTRDKIISSLKKTVADVEQLLEGIDKEAFRFKAIYDYVMASTKYKEAEGYDLFDGYSCSIASVFDFDDSTDTICQGYAKAISYLCNVFGIECIFVSSEFRNHTLNIVKIEGNWYYADSTFDDNGRHFYEFFLKGNDETWQGTIYPGNDKSERFLISKLPELDKQEYKLELDGVQYAISSPTSYAVIGVLDSAHSVVIPTAIGDMQVNEIKSNAFAGRWNLHSLTIPKGIKVNSFAISYSCKNLTVFCEDSERPENWAEDWTIDSRPVIWDCKDSGITQEGIVWGLTNDDVMLVTGYGGDEITVEIPKTVNGYEANYICENAFRDNTRLNSIIIPENISYIGKDAFAGWNSGSKAIFCKAASQPSGWDNNWNSSNCQVVWNYLGGGMSGDGFLWTIIENDEVMITGYTGSERELIIPEKIDGRAVSVIGANAFKGNISLHSVIIPESVKEIGDEAFEDCWHPKVYCKMPEFQNNNEYRWGGNGAVLWNCLENGVNEDGIEWGLTKDGIMTVMGYNYKQGGYSVDEIYIPNTIDGHAVTSICSNAFYGSRLKSIIIPNSIRTIGGGAFDECLGLVVYCEKEKPFDFSGINCTVVWNCKEHGVTDDGFKWGLTNDGYIIIVGYEGESREVSIPNTINGYSVTSILKYAFETTNLRWLIIPKSVTEIGGRIFRYCNNATVIYCRAESKPDGWDDSWNDTGFDGFLRVVWGYK